MNNVAFEREIVAERLGPPLTPTEVARKHGISSGLLYGWRQKFLGGQRTRLQPSPPGFARVEIAPSQPDKGDPAPAAPAASPAATMPTPPPGLIEILLPTM